MKGKVLELLSVLIIATWLMAGCQTEKSIDVYFDPTDASNKLFLLTKLQRFHVDFPQLQINLKVLPRDLNPDDETCCLVAGMLDSLPDLDAQLNFIYEVSKFIKVPREKYEKEYKKAGGTGSTPELIQKGREIVKKNVNEASRLGIFSLPMVIVDTYQITQKEDYGDYATVIEERLGLKRAIKKAKIKVYTTETMNDLFDWDLLKRVVEDDSVKVEIEKIFVKGLDDSQHPEFKGLDKRKLVPLLVCPKFMRYFKIAFYDPDSVEENGDEIIIYPTFHPENFYQILGEIPAEDMPVIGDGPVIFRFFDDFTCPFCKRFWFTGFKQLMKEHGDDITLIYYYLPIPTHTNSYLLSVAGAVAADYGKLLEYGDLLFQTNHSTATPESLADLATKVGIPRDEFLKKMEDKKYEAVVKKSEKWAEELGLFRTPTFIVENVVIGGSNSYEDIKKVLDYYLSHPSLLHNRKQGENPD